MSFYFNESGAVTVDWVVLTAGLVGLGLATMSVVSSGVQDTSTDVATHLGSNHIRSSFVLGSSNASFEDTTGMTPSYSPTGNLRWYSGTLNGWDMDGDASTVALIADGVAGISTVDGGFMIDMDSGAGNNVSIGQTYDDMRPGETYTLSMFAADQAETNATYGENSVEVYFGGEYVGTADPSSNVMEQFSFDLVGGSGDGTNRLTISEVGPDDQLGTYLDNIVVQ